MVIPGTKVRVRLAPSPTGPIHLGTARTGLFNWLFARQNNGVFILRIEDTDLERSEKKYEEEIIEGLKWLGITWDEGPDFERRNGKWLLTSKGDFGPYRQSERGEIYKKYLEELIQEKKAYYCYCAKEELEAEKQEMISQGLPPKYSGHCRNLNQPPTGLKPQVIRFLTPEVKIEFNDLIRGKTVFDANLFGDLIIAKDLEEPLYNFAAAVDDELMKITHVIRGEDHLSNTPKQILFQKALGFKEPLYAHLPLILSPDRSKMSKRNALTSLLEYRREGYLPEAMVNFLVLLGWHPKDNQEIFSLIDLIKEFNLKRVQKAGAVMNTRKLEWLNSHYFKEMKTETILERLKPFLEAERISASEETLKKIIEVERGRMKTLKDFMSGTSFFFKLPDYDASLLIWKQEPMPKVKTTLEKVLALIQEIRPEEFTHAIILKSLSELTEKEGRGEVFWPLRVALSGLKASPDPIAIGEALGKEETIRRLKIALSKLNDK